MQNVPVDYCQHLECWQLKDQCEQHKSTQDAAKGVKNTVESDCCSICYEIIENDHEKLSCGHHFHRKCIQPWFVLKDTCPLDRRHINGIPSDLFVKFIGNSNEYSIPLDGLTCNSTVAELAVRVRQVQLDKNIGDFSINVLYIYGNQLEGDKTLLQCGILPGINWTIIHAYFKPNGGY